MTTPNPLAPARLAVSDDPQALPSHVWPASAHRDEDGGIVVAGVRLTALAERHGTPLYVLDEAEVRQRAARVVAAFSEAVEPLGAHAHVYYAAKAFLSADVARWMRDAGLRVDVATGGELALALAAGVPADRLGLHGNDKSDDELATAVEAGVGSIVLDSAEEVGRVADAARRAGSGAAGPPPGEQRRPRLHPRVPRNGPRGPEVRRRALPGDGDRRGDPRPGGAAVPRAAQPHRLPDPRRRGIRGGRAAPADRAPPAAAGRSGARAEPRRRLRHRVHRRSGGGPDRDARDRHRRHGRRDVCGARHPGAGPRDRARSLDRRPGRRDALHRRHRQGRRAADGRGPAASAGTSRSTAA